MRKNIQLMARQFCSSKLEVKEGISTPSIQIKTKPFEFEPFKFNIERQNMIYGYTMEEIYGRYHGLKHSPEVAQEISKDTAYVIVFLIVNAIVVWDFLRRDMEEQKNWVDYFYAELPNKRDNIPN